MRGTDILTGREFYGFFSQEEIVDVSG